MEHTVTLQSMPSRGGGRPATTNTNPHMQLDQQPEDLSFVENLTEWAFTLSHIEKQPSRISVPGSIAMIMDDEHTCTKCNAFMIGTEFAHFHPHPDYSMHLGLTQAEATIVIEKGWGEWHPMILRGILPPNIIMMYAPRNQQELEVAKFILGRSYAYAKGEVQ
ncbi:MAG TPA: phospholipase [Cytophagales bacterium]|nr:phospholipase [Cytophagales bacterium]HAP60243.1 phospholipase [Cytophagales bacterium]